MYYSQENKFYLLDTTDDFELFKDTFCKVASDDAPQTIQLYFSTSDMVIDEIPNVINIQSTKSGTFFFYVCFILCNRRRVYTEYDTKPLSKFFATPVKISFYPTPKVDHFDIPKKKNWFSRIFKKK